MSGQIARFHECGCEVLGVSTDTIETHERWLTTAPTQGGLGPIQFPLASDDDGGVCKQYGVYVQRQHLALRGLFIIDPNGVLQYQVIHSLSVGRSSDEVLRVLDALQSGGLCPGERKSGEPTIDVHAELAPNRVIAHFQIESELGRGAFGTVFRARDMLLERTVALKVLRPSENVSTDALLTEARAAAALSHPNVCMIHSADTSHGAPMIIMEHVTGQPLSSQLESGPLSQAAAADFGRQIATGMAAAHEAGVVHGDLKPANVMITPNGTVKIMDFGLARRVAPTNRSADTQVWTGSSTTGLSGTPGYMAPEQACGELSTTASDVFALGLIIYEMLTGRPAISGNNILDVLRRVEHFDAAEYVDEFADPFATVLRESLVTAPAERRITMAQIAEWLSKRAVGETVPEWPCAQ